MSYFYTEKQFDDSAILDATVEDWAVLGIPRGSIKKILELVEQIKTEKVKVCFLCAKLHFKFDKLLDHLTSVHNLTQRDKYRYIHCLSVYNRNFYNEHMKGFIASNCKIPSGANQLEV